MALPAIESYTDEKLAELDLALQREKERRANLARIPEQMAELQRKYLDGDGDPAVLAAALEQPAAAHDAPPEG